MPGALAVCQQVRCLSGEARCSKRGWCWLVLANDRVTGKVQDALNRPELLTSVISSYNQFPIGLQRNAVLHCVLKEYVVCHQA